MKVMINSAMKLIAAALFLSVAGTSNAGDYKCGSRQYASGYSKGDALASAMHRLPYGAKIEKVSFNGYSTREFVPGVGYVQTQGNYKCRIDYSTY